MNVITYNRLIISKLNKHERLVYLTAVLITLSSLAFVVAVVVFKFLNLFSIIKVPWVYEVPHFNETLFVGFVMFLVLPAFQIQQRALRKISPELLSPTVLENIKKFDKGAKLFNEGWQYIKTKGLKSFIKVDPLEIKKSLIWLVVVLVFVEIIYLYNNL